VTITEAPAGHTWPPSTEPSPRAGLLVEEAADYLRCGRTHVFELIRSGQLRSVKVGRRRLVPADALKDYVEGLA